jgi:hypothetical protein
MRIFDGASLFGKAALLILGSAALNYPSYGVGVIVIALAGLYGTLKFYNRLEGRDIAEAKQRYDARKPRHDAKRKASK